MTPPLSGTSPQSTGSSSDIYADPAEGNNPNASNPPAAAPPATPSGTASVPTPDYSKSVILGTSIGYAPTYWERTGWTHQFALGLNAGYRWDHFYWAGNLAFSAGESADKHGVRNFRLLVEPALQPPLLTGIPDMVYLG